MQYSECYQKRSEQNVQNPREVQHITDATQNHLKRFLWIRISSELIATCTRTLLRTLSRTCSIICFREISQRSDTINVMLIRQDNNSLQEILLFQLKSHTCFRTRHYEAYQVSSTTELQEHPIPLLSIGQNRDNIFPILSETELFFRINILRN